jgi:hypothetical protein
MSGDPTMDGARGAGEGAPGSGVPGTGASGDFDFLVGSWDGRHRRLRKALAGCDEWDEIASSTTCWSVFGGAANIDEVTVPDLGFSGLTVRLLDPVARTWSLWWVNSKNGQMDPPPVTGSFADGVGRFYCDQLLEGRPIRCRYTWSEITPTSARWDQAFSVDDGQTWETNWTTWFTRRAEPAEG